MDVVSLKVQRSLLSVDPTPGMSNLTESFPRASRSVLSAARNERRLATPREGTLAGRTPPSDRGGYFPAATASERSVIRYEPDTVLGHGRGRRRVAGRDKRLGIRAERTPAGRFSPSPGGSPNYSSWILSAGIGKNRESEEKSAGRKAAAFAQLSPGARRGASRVDERGGGARTSFPALSTSPGPLPKSSAASDAARVARLERGSKIEPRVIRAKPGPPRRSISPNYVAGLFGVSAMHEVAASSLPLDSPGAWKEEDRSAER
ncbi:hypothetical protein KM043_004828 [Ampulex compressa]|nr:hypothetical protein KM043_004828 [Ampulex compressa]